MFWLTYGIFAESNVIVKLDESIWLWLAVPSMHKLADSVNQEGVAQGQAYSVDK